MNTFPFLRRDLVAMSVIVAGSVAVSVVKGNGIVAGLIWTPLICFILLVIFNYVRRCIMPRIVGTAAGERELRLELIMKRLGRSCTLQELAALAVSSEPSEIVQAESDLLDLVCRNRDTRRVLKRHGFTRQNLQECYERLNTLGLGCWIGDNYAAAAAIAQASTLDYVLAAATAQLPDDWEERDRWLKLVSDLKRYFESGQSNRLS